MSQKTELEETLRRAVALRDAGDYLSARRSLLSVWDQASNYRDLFAKFLLDDSTLLIRFGDLSAAETRVREGLDILVSSADPRVEANLFMNLGLISRYVGRLGDALKCQERAASLFSATTDQPGVARALINQVLILAHLNRYEMGSQLVAELREQDLPPHRQSRVELAAALLELNRLEFVTGDDAVVHVVRCDAALSRVGDVDPRGHVILKEYEADLHLEKRNPKKALELLTPVLADLEHDGIEADLIAEVSRRVAEILVFLLQPHDAIRHAMRAIDVGRQADRLEWAAGLRVAAESKMAIGEIDDGLRLFQEASGVVDNTEFVVERHRLEGAKARVGYADFHSVREANKSRYQGVSPRRRERAVANRDH